MAKEVKSLQELKTWKVIKRSKLPSNANMLPLTWAFRLKRYPDGRPRKFKARLCIRGDKQVEGIDFTETYAPVVSWPTVRMMLVMAASLGLYTKQIDFSNAFCQAYFEENVYAELPKGFTVPGGKNDGDYCLKLDRALYGAKQSPRLWYERLKSALEARDFVTKGDPCFFVHEDMVCVVYCDDVLFFGRDSTKVDEMIKNLKGEFDLTEEEDVYAFLGVQLERDKETGSITLKQEGLIKKILTTTGMLDSNWKKTPANKDPLGTDKDGDPYNEEWNYASVIGMLLYLSSNTRPDIQFAVHQCARFTHGPKQSHAEAVKRIC